MSAAQWLAAVAAVVLMFAAAGMLVALAVVVRAALRMRSEVERLAAQSDAIVASMQAALADASAEVERVEDLLSAAEAVGERVDAASRFAVRTVTGPVVRVMALGSGTRRAVARMREGEPPAREDQAAGRRRRRGVR